MKKLIMAAAFGSLFSVSAMAGEAGPKVLTGEEMDKVTAGFIIQSNYADVYQYAEADAEVEDFAIFAGSYSTVIVAASANAQNWSNIEQENEVD